jgi:hypothetical protein
MTEPMSQTVGVRGGTVAIADGPTITIPAGALADDTVITITPTTALEGALSDAYNFEPEGLTFTRPVTITLPFDPTKLAEGAVPGVATSSVSAPDYVWAESTLTDETHISAQTMHFSLYLAMSNSPTPLVSDLNFPAKMIVDTSGAYWVDQGSSTQTQASGQGRVMKLATGATAPVALAIGQLDPKALSHTGTTIAFASGGHSAATAGGATMASINSVIDTGGTPTSSLASANVAFPIAIATDSNGSVYWADSDLKTISSASSTGAKRTTLASNQNGVKFIAVSGGYVYWAASTDGAIRRVATTGGTPQTLASSQSLPMGIAVTSTSIYWCNQTGGTVVKASLDGSSPVTIASGQTKPYAIAADATNAYFTTLDGGNIVKYDGTTTSVMATAQATPLSIGADATYIYWTSNGAIANTGTLVRTLINPVMAMIRTL